MSNFTFLKTGLKPETVGASVILDGAQITNFAIFHKTIASLLHFPDYYGNNLDALDEVLNDMEFSPLKNIQIVFRNYDKLLSDEPHEKKIALLQVLNGAIAYWKKEGSRKFTVSIEPCKTIKVDIKSLL